MPIAKCDDDRHLNKLNKLVGFNINDLEFFLIVCEVLQTLITQVCLIAVNYRLWGKSLNINALAICIALCCSLYMDRVHTS